MKFLKGLTSTLSMIAFFFIGNVLFYLLLVWFPNWAILHVIVAAFMNAAIGVMITYNALVSMNKKTIRNMLEPKP